MCLQISIVDMGTVITISPRESLDKVERHSRTRIERDGVVEVAAGTSDGRQIRQLRRLTSRLAADPDLDVFYGERTDGNTYVTVHERANRASRRGLGSWGDPKTVEDPGGPYLP